MTQPLTDAIEALTQYANTVTGASDQTLSEAVATLASGYGGGGGLELLTSVTTSEQALNMQIDFDPSWADYSFIMIDGVIELTANDWLYFDFDTNNPQDYKGGSQIWYFCRGFNEGGLWSWRQEGRYAQGKTYSGFPAYLYIKAYTASKPIKSGQTINVWGVK